MNVEHSKSFKQAYSSLDKILVNFKSSGSRVIVNKRKQKKMSDKQFNFFSKILKSWLKHPLYLS